MCSVSSFGSSTGVVSPLRRRVATAWHIFGRSSTGSDAGRMGGWGVFMIFEILAMTICAIFLSGEEVGESSWVFWKQERISMLGRPYMARTLKDMTPAVK